MVQPLSAGFTRTSTGFNPVAEHSYGIPAPYYFSPDIYARERDAIWFKTWQYVGCTQELAAPGSYLTAHVLDQHVVVVRDKVGELRAFFNVCRHRGHVLAEGRGSTAALRCPFHAWTYDLDGRLIGAPNSENVPGFTLDEFTLVPVRLETLGFMIFVNLDANARPLAEIAAGLLEDFRAQVPNFDAMKLTRTETFEVKANWKFILDGLECYHCPYIHPEVMGKDGYVTQSFDTREQEFWTVHINRGKYDLLEKHKDRLPYPLDEVAIRDIVIWFLWPNLVFVARQGPSNFQILQADPQGPELTRRHMINFCLNEQPTKYDLGHMDQYRNVAWPQDRKAMEMQALGVKSLGFRQGRLMVDPEHSWRSEHGTHHFQHLVWLALNGPHY